MKPSKSYTFSLKIGIVIEVILSVVMIPYFMVGVTLSAVNMLCILFLYPIIYIYVLKRSWPSLDLSLGPHQ